MPSPVERSAEVLDYLLKLVATDAEPMIRHRILRMLVDKPPCERNAPPGALASEQLVERLWTLMK